MMPHLDTEQIREGVLRWLAAASPSDDEIRRLHRRPPPGSSRALISIEPSGVRANTSAFWWTREGPFFTISILALLHIPLVNREEVAVWVKRQQREDGAIRAGRLDPTARHATFATCALLRMLGADREDEGWRRDALVDRLRAQQRPDERRPIDFLACDSKSLSAELQVANCWSGSLAALDEQPVNRDAAVRYLQAMQAADGRFRRGWVRRLPYGEEEWTRDAVRSLAALGAMPLDPAACAAEIQSWQADDGGFLSWWACYPDHPMPAGGTHSYLNTTSWSVIALSLLGAGPRDRAAAVRKLASLWDAGRGCFMNHTSEWADHGYPRFTYWGLLALSLLGGLRPPPAPDPVLRTLALLSYPGV